MKTLETIDKIVQFYERPETGYGSKDNGHTCNYFIDEHHRCGVGCLLDNAQALEQYVQVRFLADSVSYRGIFALAKEWADGKIQTEDENLIAAFQEILALPPEDVPPSLSHFGLFTTLQAIHDKCASFGHPKEELIKELKLFRRKMELMINEGTQE